MPKKRWHHDGPSQSSKGFEYDWAYFSAEMAASAEHGRNWKELNRLRDYFRAHPYELKDLQSRWGTLSPLERQRAANDLLGIAIHDSQK